MQHSKRSTRLLFCSLILLLGLACQAVTPRPTATPNPTATQTATPTSTPTPLPPTFTPTPVTEENTWKTQCSSVSELGRIGDGQVNHIALSGNKKLTAVSAAGSMTLYDNEEGAEAWTVRAKVPFIQAVFVNLDTELLAMDKELRLTAFNVKTGRVIYATKSVDAMTGRLSEDGTLVMLANWLGSTYVYDTQEFNVVASTEDYIEKHETVTLFINDLIYSSIQFSPDSKLVMTAAFSGRITFFGARNGALVAEYPLDHRATPENVVFSGDSKRLAIEYREENSTQHIRVLNVRGGFLKQDFQGTHPALSRDGKLLASRLGEKIMVWEVETGNLLKELVAKGHPAGQLRFSSDDQSLFSSSTTGIQVWSVADGTLARQLPGSYSMYLQAAVSENRDLVALRSKNYVQIRHVLNDALGIEIPSAEPIQYIAFNQDGTRLAGIIGEKALIWDPQNGQVLDELELGGDFSGLFAFTADPDQFIAGGTFTDLALLQFEDGTLKASHRNTALKPSSFAAAWDGTLVATGAYDTGITLSEPDGWKTIRNIAANDKGVEKLAFAPSGKVLAAGMDNRSIKIWSTDGKLLCTLKDQPDYLQSLSFGTDGNSLFLSALEEGFIRIVGVKGTIVPGDK